MLESLEESFINNATEEEEEKKRRCLQSSKFIQNLNGKLQSQYRVVFRLGCLDTKILFDFLLAYELRRCNASPNKITEIG